MMITGTIAVKAADEMAFVENEHIRVGVNLKWGGAVTHVSEPGGPNLINSHDLGRQIQQSYYSGPANYQREGKEKAKHWGNFPWNPIQTGDAFDNGSEVLEHRVQGDTLYVKTIPNLWPMNNDAGECVMETAITIASDGPKLLYWARLTNRRSDKSQYTAKPQEIPAIYANGPWHRLMTYTGDKPFTGEPLREIRNGHKEPWPWVKFLATERWAALVNDKGTGIGVCVPEVREFHGGFAGRQRGTGDEKSTNTGYMSPMTTEILDHNIVYEYSCTMILGSLEEIREEARSLAAKDGLPSWEFETSRNSWFYANGKDGGWPLPEGGGLSPVPTKKGRSVRLISPYTFWRAESAASVQIELSSKSAGKMQLFWRDTPPAAASTKPSQWRAWRDTGLQKARSVSADIPQGSRKKVTIKLAGAAGYQGGLTGLAIDLPDGVTVHAVRLLAQ
tara:strand:- start:35 stop:1375 length:1341 start_codon:yes stop_codon:yes gene_type:complete